MSIQNKEQKLKTLESIAVALNKEYGDNSFSRLGSKRVVPIDFIPTGIIGLDQYVIGCGGIPRGRVTEIFGPESSGKTTLCLHTIANAQKAGGTAAYIDAENALDLGYAKVLRVEVDNMFLSQPMTGEEGLNIAEAAINSGGVDIVVVDSVAAMIPRQVLEGEFGDANMGAHARLMSQACAKLSGAVRRNNVALIFINQIRMNLGVKFGSPETTPGGRALRFYASLRLDIRAIGSGKEDDGSVSSRRTKIEAKKNKVGTPFRKTETDMKFGAGLDAIGNLVETALQIGLIEKAGSWYSLNGERLGQGLDKASDLIRTNETLRQQLIVDTTKKLEMQ